MKFQDFVWVRTCFSKKDQHSMDKFYFQTQAFKVTRGEAEQNRWVVCKEFRSLCVTDISYRKMVYPHPVATCLWSFIPISILLHCFQMYICIKYCRFERYTVCTTHEQYIYFTEQRLPNKDCTNWWKAQKKFGHTRTK